MTKVADLSKGLKGLNVQTTDIQEMTTAMKDLRIKNKECQASEQVELHEDHMQAVLQESEERVDQGPSGNGQVQESTSQVEENVQGGDEELP